MNPHQVTREFERAVAEYTGAPYCVAVNSCTNALFLCLMYQYEPGCYCPDGISIPKRTYLSVPMQIKHAGFKVSFRDEEWRGMYQLEPLPIWDSARLFRSEMFFENGNRNKCYDVMGRKFMCTSHHWSKTLGIQQGGCILHNDRRADEWFRRARFDGRSEGIAPKNDRPMLGWHMYLSPEVAAEGLVRLAFLPRHNEPLPNDDYPDLSTLDIFK